MTAPGATARQVVVMALRKLGVVTRRTPPKEQDIQDGLDALWLLLESFNTQLALIPFYTKYQFTLATDQRLYTIGPSGDFNMPIPLEILSAQIIDSGGTYHPVSVVNGIQYFQNVNPGMDGTSNRPNQVIWNPSIPTGTLEFCSVPSEASTLALAVKLPWTVENCASCTDNLSSMVSESDYTISIDGGQVYCDDNCELDVIQQMRDWLDTQAQSCEPEEIYQSTFEYNGLSVDATARLSIRTAPNPVSLTVPQNMEFPVGYVPLIMWKLAEAMLPEYPQDSERTVAEIKNQGALLMRQIKSKNSKPGRIQYDPSLLAGVGRQSNSWYQ